MPPAVDGARQQPGILQQLYVFRGACEAHARWGCEFPDREFPFYQPAQYRPPRRIGERMENGIGALFNHMV